jgi:hypothetical protein
MDTLVGWLVCWIWSTDDSLKEKEKTHCLSTLMCVSSCCFRPPSPSSHIHHFGFTAFHPWMLQELAVIWSLFGVFVETVNDFSFNVVVSLMSKNQVVLQVYIPLRHEIPTILTILVGW